MDFFLQAILNAPFVSILYLSLLLTRTCRRLLTNPSFYGLSSTEPEPLRAFLEQLIGSAISQLQTSCCISVSAHSAYSPLFLGHIVSKYYLSHLTARAFTEMLGPDTNEAEALRLLASCEECVQRFNLF